LRSGIPKNSAIHLKSNILPPPNFWAGYATGVVPISSHKLHERVFPSFSCFFTFTCSSSSPSNPHSCIFGPFWRPLWPSALGSRLVCLMVMPALPIQLPHTLKSWLHYF